MKNEVDFFQPHFLLIIVVFILSFNKYNSQYNMLLGNGNIFDISAN